VTGFVAAYCPAGRKALADIVLIIDGLVNGYDPPEVIEHQMLAGGDDVILVGEAPALLPEYVAVAPQFAMPSILDRYQFVMSAIPSISMISTCV
jgi:hypothetical protein